MSPVRILVMYNGDWVFNESGYEYSGDKLKGIVVDEKITYVDLLDRVCNIVKVDPAEFVVTMKCVYKAQIPTPPTEILDNDDVDFFIGENVVDDHSRRTPLCITIKSREPTNLLPAPIDSGSVSNQTSGLAPTAQHSQFPSICPLPLAEIEGQNTTPLSCGPQAALNCDVAMQNVDQHGDGNDDRAHDNVAENGHIDNDNYVGSNGPSAFDGLAIQSVENSIEEFRTPEQLNTAMEPCLYSEQLHIVPENLPLEQLTSDDMILVGQVYPSKKDVQSKLSLMAIRGKFELKVKRSTKRLLFVVCMDKSCRWRLRASKMLANDNFMIRKFHRVHTCMAGNSHRNHPQASSWVVGQLIKSKFEEGEVDYRPNDIIKDVEEQFGVTISYDKAWRAREIALSFLKRSRDKEKRQRGRPKKEKIVPIDKEPSLRLCGSCGSIGHNRKTCKSPLALQ